MRWARAPPQGGYDRGRGARVVARARVFLDEAFPVEGTSHADARRYVVKDGALLVDDLPLVSPEKFVGYRGNPKAPDAVLLRNNGLHVELVFDRAHFIGSRDQALLADVQLESAMSAIMDCEDSVACVDAEDKVQAYGNWLGLMQGDLADSFDKGGQQMTRRLAEDRDLSRARTAARLALKGRALMWVRNVGHLMTNPAILLPDGSEVPEGLMDAMVTTLIAMHDLKKTDGLRNSVMGSVYVVKPKMHGPEEVAFADEIFGRVEAVLGPACEHRETGHHGRRTPHLGEPQGMHPRGHGTGWPSSTPAFSTAPATRSIPHGSRPLQPQGLHQAQGLDHGL